MKRTLLTILSVFIPAIIGINIGVNAGVNIGVNSGVNMEQYSIKKVKQPSVAGSFYTSDKQQLISQIDRFKKESKNTYTTPTRAVIVPHAGLVYSGRLAYEGISQLDKGLKTIFIFAPAHRVGFSGLALTSYDAWTTPLGEIGINRTITNELAKKFGAKVYDEAINPEHAIEIEVPIIQYLFKDVKIVPVLIGKESADKVSEIIAHYYKDPQNGFVISSDLSHYLSDPQAKRVDNYTANLIETGTCENFSHELACGATGIMGLIKFANQQDYSLIRIDMSNSGDTTADKSRVVGYGCWFLYEGDTNKFIKDNYSEFILKLVKDSIKSKFGKEMPPVKYPAIFSEYGAVFVTLEKNGRLRGCIGSIIPNKPLIDDIIHNSKNAAFSDPRFNPVEEKELKDLSIAVSILSIPKPMTFKDEKDLLNQIRPNIDGIIIKDGNYQAVYLPSVWEMIPDKKEFLNSLKVKAGLPANHFSKNFQAYRFVTEYIKED